MRTLQLALLALLLVILAGNTWAGTATPCPSTGNAQYCNEVIVINSNGSVSIYDSSSTGGYNITSTPYDGSEDQLIGVIDNWAGGTVKNLGLTGTSITDFDADGANAGGSACVTTQIIGTLYGCNGASNVLDASHGATGYAGFDSSGNGVTNGIDNYFTNFTTPGSAATINFAGGLTNGETAWFSLEEPANAGGLGVSVNVPEPGSVLLLGTALCFAATRLRRRKV